MKLDQIEKRIERIKKQLQEIGEMRPGSLSKQYNVCGKAGCRCKDETDPKKHGPYYQLSYGHKGKSTTQFIRPDMIPAIKKQLTNYKRFKALTEEWIDLALQHSKLAIEISRRRASD
jgi:hypothetical protein